LLIKASAKSLKSDTIIIQYENYVSFQDSLLILKDEEIELIKITHKKEKRKSLIKGVSIGVVGLGVILLIDR